MEEWLTLDRSASHCRPLLSATIGRRDSCMDVGAQQSPSYSIPLTASRKSIELLRARCPGAWITHTHHAPTTASILSASPSLCSPFRPNIPCLFSSLFQLQPPPRSSSRSPRSPVTAPLRYNGWLASCSSASVLRLFTASLLATTIDSAPSYLLTSFSDDLTTSSSSSDRP